MNSLSGITNALPMKMIEVNTLVSNSFSKWNWFQKFTSKKLNTYWASPFDIKETLWIQIASYLFGSVSRDTLKISTFPGKQIGACSSQCDYAESPFVFVSHIFYTCKSLEIIQLFEIIVIWILTCERRFKKITSCMPEPGICMSVRSLE